MPSFLEQASDAIRQSGGRMTGQRQIIVNLLESATGQLDVDDLHRLARKQDQHISLATVYRTLNVLEDAGLIQPRYQSPEHEHKYYERVGSGQVYHFTCRVCRKIIPFHSELIQELKHHLSKQLDLEVLNACVCLDGLCPECQKQQAQTDR
ncbi:MAG: transcriptional repressor [Anaerolinea sp.]|nr:transcriptional repressor [Anaerolinea sp.]MCC6972791.1 transcriptional repressor [Anaerolineae bacterium]CAG1015500.1 Peroxide-responsive repressor PerR [Anaerolineae bacterium]